MPPCERLLGPRPVRVGLGGGERGGVPAHLEVLRERPGPLLVGGGL